MVCWMVWGGGGGGGGGGRMGVHPQIIFVKNGFLNKFFSVWED